MRVEAVIFDLDGTLLDTGEGVIRSVKYTISQMNLKELPLDKLAEFVGPPIKRKLQQEFGLSNEQAEEGMNIFRSHYGLGDIYIAQPYDGVEKILKQLKDKNFKLGVATYKREDQAIKLLERKGLAKYFDVISGTDLNGKMTKTDVICKCLENLNCLPKKAIMVGDSENDAVGAAEVGMNFIGVTYGYGFKSNDDVIKYNNIGYADKCIELYHIILAQYENYGEKLYEEKGRY